MTPDEKAELRRLVDSKHTFNMERRRDVDTKLANAIPKLLDELEEERERADSLAAQVAMLRGAISDWLADYSPSSEAMHRAAAALADTAGSAAEWKRQERLVGAREFAAWLHAQSDQVGRRYVQTWIEDWQAAMEAEASQEGAQS